ncbi:MAG: hypothetical protein HW401_394 [Parcubacteria group bacterium]|nr:hypothetical protein [Parcubacteria group bacterium]
MNKYFPDKIGRFSFLKEFNPSKRKRHFDFAIYKDETGKIAIAKQWNDSCKYLDYLWLVNEIKVYKAIHKVIELNIQIIKKFPNIHIPNLYGAVSEKNRLTMLIEKIGGQSLNAIPLENQVEVFKNAMEFLSAIGEKMDKSARKSLIKRNIWYVIAIFPLIFISAVIRNPKKIFQLISGAVFFSLNIFRTIDYGEMSLVHRDLYSDNILIKDGDVWIIDFQISAIASPAFETAGLMSNLWKDAGTREVFKNSGILENIMKDKNKFYAYKTLSIYTAFYNLGMYITMTPDQALSYLRYSLDLKFSK